MIRFGFLSNLLSNLMYKDTFTLSKTKIKTSRNPDGSNSSEVLDSFLQNEPCLVWETSNDSSQDGNMDVARQQVTVKIFTDTHHDITRGDFLILSVKDEQGNTRKTIKGYAGQPCFFPDHLEIELYDWKVS